MKYNEQKTKKNHTGLARSQAYLPPGLLLPEAVVNLELTHTPIIDCPASFYNKSTATGLNGLPSPGLLLH